MGKSVRMTKDPEALRIEARPGQGKSAVREYAEAFIIAILLALVIRTFVVQAFKIPSGSMLPTLQIGDHILVNKFLYYFEPIRRGDIIVFKFPQDESRDFIKRVIGLPGDTIEVRDKQVVVNGRPLTEPYAAFDDGLPARSGEREHFGPITVPTGKLFMMGDNRDHSMDSRYWGLLDMHKVKGKAFIIYFSVRSDDIPYQSILPSIMYTVGHPSMIRWSRIGELIH